MNDTELIQVLRPMVVRDKFQCLGCGHEHQCSTHGCAILKQALERLEQLAAPEANPPLTLEELREMDGELVWVTCFDSWRLCYGLSDYRGYLCMETGNGSCILMKDYGEKWLAYRRKPEEGMK